MKLRSGLLHGSVPKPSVQLLLTSQNLQQFNQKRASITSIKETSNSNNRTTSSSSSSTASSTDPMLSTHLYDAGVRFQGSDALAPDDLDNLSQYLHQITKNQLNKEQAQDFLQRLTKSRNEEVFKTHFISVIFNPASRRLFGGYSIQMDLEWTAVKQNFTTINGLSNPKPDYFETFDEVEYPIKGRSALGWSLLPCLSHSIAMPTLCVEFKAPGKGPRNAVAQAAYDGAIMVHTAWERHKYMRRPAEDFFGKTQALVITIADNDFGLFACHAIPTDWKQKQDKYPIRLSYHIFELVGSRISSENDLRTICRSIHNAQDWCRTQAESAKTDLWEYVKKFQEQETQSFTEQRKKNNARRIAFNTERKRKMMTDETQQIRPTKLRKTRGSSDSSSASASTAR